MIAQLVHPRPAASTQLSRRLGILVLLAALGACGGDGGRGPDRADARADEADVKAVLDDALDALYGGDGARACSLYTSSYRRELVRENRADRSEGAPKGVSCEQQVREFEPVLERFVPNRDVKVIRVAVRGDRATAVSEFKTTRGKTRLKEFLVRQDGEWKIDGDQEAGEAAPQKR